MTSPAARREDGVYVHPQTGEEFPSYSSVASMLARPALQYWAANQVAQSAVYDRGEIESVTTKILFEQYEKGEEPDSLAARYHALRGAPWRQRDRKADLGTAVHAAIEYYQQDGLPGIYPADVAPFMVQFEKFLNDFKPHIIANEVTIYNRTIGYAGTLDMLADLEGKMTLIDLKTGKGVYPDAAIQVNAYANGEVFYDEWERKDIDLPQVEAAYVLHLRPKRYELIPVTLSQENFDVFCSLREIYRWDKGAKKTALGMH